MSGQIATVESIFLEAAEKTSRHERDAFLTAACGGDRALRERVETLLKAHDDAGSFLAEPAFQPDAFETRELQELQANTPPLENERTVPGVESEDLVLEFLDTPREPGHLGTIGPYDVTEVIGRGGMGVVLKAHDPRLNRVVAIKVLSPALASNAAARKRFLREAQAAAAVTHDHVVAIYAIDEAKHLPYLVMEYVAGQSLQQKIDAAGPLEVKEIVRIGRQIAAGLAAAHEQGLIHRDIKPANILLENGVERVKITDFGLARAVGDVGVTQTGFLAGTPQYMSPEQAHGERVDYRSDLFSLGSVLYAMCTGRPPFRGESPVAVIRRVCEETPKPISQVNPDTPDWLAKIVERLLEKDPDQRFHSAAEIVELLGQCLEHLQQPALRQPPVVPQSLSTASESAPTVIAARQRPSARTDRRRRWAVAAAVLVLVAVGLGVTEATGVTDVGGFVATVLRIRTPQGTLVVELNDPAASVAIDADEETITFSGIGPHEIKLRPGRHPVRALKDGKAVRTEWVTITRGDRQVVNLHLEETETAQKQRGSQKPRSPASADEARALQTQWAKKLGKREIESNSLGMKLAFIPPGVFDMGRDGNENGANSSELVGNWFFTKLIPERLRAETPNHRVEISQPFYLGIHEVSVGQFKKFIEESGYTTTAEVADRGGFGWKDGEWVREPGYNWKNPGFDQTDAHPVNNVSWDDAVAFCSWISKKENAVYRLPTEAEWEYACRAGTTTRFSSGDHVDSLAPVANIADQMLRLDSESKFFDRRRQTIINWAVNWTDGVVFTAPVGSFKPNAFGLDDMHGNVWEWCSDWYDPDYYRVSPTVNPQGPSDGEYHVFRGGGWDNHPIFCRSADRYSSHSPTLRTDWAGFRVVKVISTSSDAESAAADKQAIDDIKDAGHPGVTSAPALEAVLQHTSRQAGVRAVTLSPGSWWAVVGRDDGTIDVFEIGKREIVHSRQLSDPITAVAFSPDGRWLAAASGKVDRRQAKVHLWSIVSHNNQPITPNFAGGANNTEWNVNSGQVPSLAFSPDGNLLIAGVGDDQAGELIVWSTKDFQEKSRYPGFQGRVRLLAVGPDNHMTLAGSSDGSFQIIDLKAGKTVTKMNFAMAFPQQKQQQPKLIQSLVYLSAERGLLATGDETGSVSTLEFPRGVERLSFKPQETAIEALAFSPDGKLLATAGRGDSAVKVWNIADKIR